MPPSAAYEQEVPQHEGATGLEPRRVEISRGEGGDDGHPAASAGDRDVEAALATLEVERPETVQHPAVRGLAVADREDDRVSLVALDPLEVLDEEPLGGVLVEEVADVGADQGRAQREVDPGRMLDAERDDAERLARARARMRQNQLDDPVDLGLRGLDRLEARLDRRRAVDDLETDHGLVAGAGKGDECAVIHLGVGKGDQPLVQRAVVPGQPADRQRGREDVEDRLEPLGQRVVGGVSSSVLVERRGEEAGRGQLPLVARDDHLGGA